MLNSNVLKEITLKQNKLLNLVDVLNNDNNANANANAKKKIVPIQKKQQIKQKDGKKNIVLEYMGDIDDKLFNTVTVKILAVL